jgi:hypothetical protein
VFHVTLKSNKDAVSKFWEYDKKVAAETVSTCRVSRRNPNIVPVGPPLLYEHKNSYVFVRL